VRDENHFLLWRRHLENSGWLSADNETAGNAGTKTGDSQMRTSASSCLAFVLAPSVAGLSETCRASDFAYNGLSIVTSAPQGLVVAAN